MGCGGCGICKGEAGDNKFRGGGGGDEQCAARLQLAREVMLLRIISQMVDRYTLG